MSNGWARSLTEAGLLLNRSSTWRRVGSDNARKTLSIGRLLAPAAGAVMAESSCFPRRATGTAKRIYRPDPKTI